MTTISIIENKISAVKNYLKILEKYRALNIDDIVNDVDKKGATERYLYLVSQATINLSESIIAYKKFRKPTTMSESFHILNEEGLIPVDLTEKMVKMTGFRNVVAHDYDKINYSILDKVLKEGLDDIEKFVEIVSDYFQL